MGRNIALGSWTVVDLRSAGTGRRGIRTHASRDYHIDSSSRDAQQEQIIQHIPSYLLKRGVGGVGGHNGSKHSTGQLDRGRFAVSRDGSQGDSNPRWPWLSFC